jgi:hypothetical protein
MIKIGSYYVPGNQLVSELGINLGYCTYGRKKKGLCSSFYSIPLQL